MSALSTTLDLLRATLAAHVPARVVSRDFVDFAQRPDADLLAGVYSLLSTGEGGYANFVGREAQLGTLNVMIIWQGKVGEDATPSACEDAEGVAVDEIKALCGSVLPAGIDGMVLISWRNSGQFEHPYCWVAFEMEIAP